MTKKIIYLSELGGLNLVAPTGEISIEEVAKKDIPTGSPYRIVEDSELPANSAFFGAWEANFDAYRGITVNLDKAKAIFKQTADARSIYLSQPLTQEYMRLTAIGGDTTAVQAQLQAINATAEETAYLDATTVPELVACWPPELGPNPFLPVSPEVA
jgi:hypothetical protein